MATCQASLRKWAAVVITYNLSRISLVRVAKSRSGLPVKVSAKTEYACLAMIELAASHGSGSPVQVRKIAEQHGIPQRFLVQILLQLKGAGLVLSTRGATGGYQLLRPPGEISLGEIVQVIEGGPDAETPPASATGSIAAKVLTDVWHELTQHEQQLLASIKLTDLVERARTKDQNMYYI